MLKFVRSFLVVYGWFLSKFYAKKAGRQTIEGDWKNREMLGSYVMKMFKETLSERAGLSNGVNKSFKDPFAF